MVVTFSWRNLTKRTKLGVKLVFLAIILFYILPKLLSLFWQANEHEIKIREQRMLEKPLRVINSIIDNC